VVGVPVLKLLHQWPVDVLAPPPIARKRNHYDNEDDGKLGKDGKETNGKSVATSFLRPLNLTMKYVTP